MDFKHIEAFVKVIELGSFSKAAEEIFLSQPSVSTYINQLEQELGETLINRSTKEILPTYSGKIFYENAKEILALKQRAVARIKTVSGDFSGEINVLASSVPSQYILPKMLARFREDYPDIAFHVKQTDTLGAAEGVASGIADIGFTGSMVRKDKCAFNEIMTERMIFIAPLNQSFSEAKEYGLTELLYYHTFISREKGSGTRTEYEEFFLSQDVDLSRVKGDNTFDNTQSIITAVINGLGVAIVSEFAAQPFIDGGMIMPLKLKIDLPTRKFYYVLKKGFSYSHLVNLLVNFLKDDVEQNVFAPKNDV